MPETVYVQLPLSSDIAIDAYMKIYVDGFARGLWIGLNVLEPTSYQVKRTDTNEWRITIDELEDGAKVATLQTVYVQFVDTSRASTKQPS